MSAEKPALWGMEDDERLSCTEIGERVQKFCEEYEDDKPLPETIDLIGYDPMKVNVQRNADWILTRLLESLDDEYMDPEGDYTEPTENMKQASKEFVEKVLSEYHVWNCEGVCEKTVRIKDYMTDEDLKELGWGGAESSKAINPAKQEKENRSAE